MSSRNLVRRCVVPAALLALSATIGADAVDGYVASTMRRLHIPGMSLAIVRNGKILKAKSYGWSDLESRVPATNQSAFMIGSISKQFEAAAILALAEDGKLRLDDPITAYLDHLPSSWGSITIRNLMTHTSGLKDYTELPEHESDQAKPVTRDELIRFVGRYPLEFEPGTKWAYSNTGSYLEGMIIEKVTGMPYEAFARKRLWLRAGMRSTRINRWNELVRHRVQGYVWHDGEQHHPDFEDDSWPWAGGGCVSTLDDMVAWMRALETDQVVNRASLKSLWSPINLGGLGTYPFGLDWFLSDLRGRPRIFRTGQIGGFSALVLRYPEARLDIILLCNQAGIETPRVASHIAGLIDHGLAPVSAVVAPSDPDPAVTSHIKKGIADLASGATISPWVTPALIASTTDQQKAIIEASIKANASLSFIGADDVRRRPIERLGSRIVAIRHYAVRFADVEFFVGIYLDGAGRIAYVLNE